jgi:hypothetical protein
VIESLPATISPSVPGFIDLGERSGLMLSCLRRFAFSLVVLACAGPLFSAAAEAASVKIPQRALDAAGVGYDVGHAAGDGKITSKEVVSIVRDNALDYAAGSVAPSVAVSAASALGVCASTGTPIAALSGAAATSATLAAIGGAVCGAAGITVAAPAVVGGAIVGGVGWLASKAIRTLLFD